jgi:S1-C subfamily serine protease
VSDGSPAQQAGIARGDLIVAIGDDQVDDPAGLEAALARRQPGDTIVVKVVRGADELSLTVQFPPAGQPEDAPEDAPVDAPSDEPGEGSEGPSDSAG